MKYDSLSRGTVKITLSEADMREYSLCTETITRHTAEAKRGLSRMLKKMKLFSGYKPDRLFLEAFPSEEGGLILYVSNLCDENEREEAGEAALMCCVDSLSALIQLCHTLKNGGIQPQTCVYRSHGGYILVAIAEKTNLTAMKRIFSEFGRVCADTSEICTVSEYAVPVCFSDACSVFAELY